MTQITAYDAFTAVMEFEAGTCTEDQVLELFAHLIKTGMAWTLQGSYGRTAQSLIEQGLISKEGEVL